jgi:N-acetylglutamate synthase-like GNAT family acetyltransferase
MSLFHRPAITIQRAAPADWPRVEAFYRDRQYRGDISSSATIVTAERDAILIGVGRVQMDEQQLVLRGMRVDSRFQRRGVGRRILDQLIIEIGDRSCYCVPYAHLRGFYGRAGFAEIDLDEAPAFLHDRVIGYRAEGLDVLLMRR